MGRKVRVEFLGGIMTSAQRGETNGSLKDSRSWMMRFYPLKDDIEKEARRKVVPFVCVCVCM